MEIQEPIYVTRSVMPDFEEYCQEIRSLWDTRVLTNCGEKHQQLESELGAYLGVRYVDLFVNGHAALECVLEAMELGKDGRDEVITTPFTFASTTHAIVRKGLKPVFCDIKPDDYTIDSEKAKALVTPRTCAILPVHVYGNLCDVDAIAAIADEHDLRVIYDAAHAFGVEKDGRGIASFGDASMFSFHATKVFHSVEGGAIAHASDSLSARLAVWRNFGQESPEDVPFAGGNAKMNEFAAAMGLCNLRHVDEAIALRRQVAERYWALLDGVPGARVCRPQEGIRANYAYLPVVFDPDAFGATRDQVYDALAAQNIFARKYFYPLTSRFACYEGSFDGGSTPVAHYMAENVLCLPIYPELALTDVDRISEAVLSTSRRG